MSEDFSEIGTEDVSGSPSPAAEDSEPSAGTAPPASAQPAESASGGDTPTAQPAPGPVPYDRFQEVVRARQEAEQRLNQSQPWDPIIQALQQAGLTPQQAQEYLSNPPQQQPTPPATDPEEAFEAHLQQLGLTAGFDPYLLEPHQRATIQRAFEAEQRIATFEQGLQQREQALNQQAYRAKAEAEYAGVIADPKYGAFKGNVLKSVLATAYNEQQGRVPMQQIAAMVQAEIDQVAQARLAEHLTARQQDARAPVVQGGNAPAPANKLPDIHEPGITQQERDRRIEARIAAMGGL